MNAPEILYECVLNAPVTIRTCSEEDLLPLEWFGHFTAHREIIREAYRKQERGENLMLVAELRGFPAGQVWIDLEKKKDERAAFIWALRVFPVLQGLGLGRCLMLAAERAARARGFRASQLGVEKDKPETAGLVHFYQRLGYEPLGELQDHYHYTTPEGSYHEVLVDQIVLGKNLHQAVTARARPPVREDGPESSRQRAAKPRTPSPRER